MADRPVAKRAQQTADLDELSDAFLTASRVLLAVAVRSMEAAPIEVTVQQHRVLVLLASRGDLSIGQIAEHLDINQSNASRICDRLERMRVLRRRRSSADGRVVRVELTRQGRAVLDAVTVRRHDEIRSVLARMRPADAMRAQRALLAFSVAAAEPVDVEWVTPA